MDVTVKLLEQLESYQGRFLYARKGLGVQSFGMNVLIMPAGWDGYPDHDHASDGQEEVYVVLEGSVTLHAGEQTWPLSRGSLARVGAAQKRKLVPGPDGATVLALGGTPGKAYQPK